MNIILDDNAVVAMESTLPSHMWGAIKRYFENHIHPGGFLTAILCNDLSQAFGRADEVNEGSIKNYVAWLTWHVPSIAWGSTEKVNAWLANED